MNARKLAASAATIGLTLGLIGAGVSAQYTDSVSAAVSTNVGTFGCTVSSTDPNTVVTNDHSITINLPTIQSGSAGNSFVQDVTVTNTGSIPTLVHWTFATGGTMAANQWQPTGAFGYATGTQVDNMTTDLTLAAGAHHTYGAGGNGVGFIWATIDNSYLGKSASVTYTANCGEVPAGPQSNISFVGIASEAGHAALTLPSGWVPGDFAVVLEAGSSAPATPAGYTSIQTGTAPRNATFYRSLVAGDTAVPAAATTVTDIEVAVYRGVSGIGSHTVYSANSNNVGQSGGSGLYYPLGRQNATPLTGAMTDALDGVTGPAMTKTDGSSWVVLMGYDAYASTNMSQMGPFQKLVAPLTQQPAVLDGTVAANRSAATTDAHTGLADTGAGVAAFGGGAWGVTGDNFPLPGTHGVALHTIELLSQ